MKRPFILTGILSLIISAITLSCSRTPILLLILCFLVCIVLMYTLLKKKVSANSNYFVFSLTIALVLISSLFTVQYIYTPVSLLADTKADIKVTVTSEPYTYLGNAYYYLKGEHPLLGGEFKCALSSDNLGLEIGDSVNMTVCLSELSDSYKSHNLSNGIFVSATALSVNSIVKKDSKFYSSLGELRLYIKNEIFKDVRGDNGAVLIALLTGDREHISNNLYEKTKLCGVTHILVVSGMHLSIISGAVLNLFSKLKLKRKLAVFIIILLIFVLVLICNFHTSAIRSAIMSVIMLSASLISRKADPMNSLGFAVTVMVLFNPFVAGSAAFLLSVSATLGVLFVAPMIKFLTQRLRFTCKFSKFLNSALDVIIVSVSAFICVLPISVYYYGYTSIISPLVTLLIATSVELALILTSLAILLSLLPITSVFSSPLIMISEVFSVYINSIISFFGSTDIFVLVIDLEYTPLCFIFSAAVVFTLWLFYNKKLKERKDENATLGKGSKNLA